MTEPTMPSDQDATDLIDQLEDVHANTEDDDRAGVILAALSMLRRYRRAARATAAQTALDEHLHALGVLAVVDALELPPDATAEDLTAALAARGLRIALVDQDRGAP